MKKVFLKDFDVVLLDLDGLLIDSEPLHYVAFQKSCEDGKCAAEMSYYQYLKLATNGKEALLRYIESLFPNKIDYIRNELYKVKADEYMDLLNINGVDFMPEADSLLKYLQKNSIMHALVTNSTRPMVNLCSKGKNLLRDIPYILTREYYNNPKPSTDAYKKVLDDLGCTGAKVLGLEDSVKGISAMNGLGITPILISEQCLLPDDRPDVITFNCMEEFLEAST